MFELQPTRCAICGTAGNCVELYPANFSPESLTPAVFSARRLPDRIHYRMVKCWTCGLVRSDPIIDSSLLEQLYHQSDFTYREEVTDLKRTYGRYLAKLGSYGACKDALLEIGCGNGFFLEEALTQGYRAVKGVEPAQDAISQSSTIIRDSLICDVMRPGLFPPHSFDVVCMFQVFDHLSNPASLLDECLRVLRPGGLTLAINHNVKATSAFLLGAKSPIIDIEHTYLYSKATMSRIFAAQGFQILNVGSVCNRYSLRYLMHLLPLPSSLKHIALSCLHRSCIGELRLWLPLGNLYLIARKPPHLSQ